MRPKAPHWSLKQVHAAVNDGGVELTKTRAIDPLLQYEPKVVNRSEAIEHATEVVRSLKGSDFSHTVKGMQSVSDVYGVQIDGRDWWIKLTIEEVEDEKRVLVISFHPPESELTTVGGLELKPW